MSNVVNCSKIHPSDLTENAHNCKDRLDMHTIVKDMQVFYLLHDTSVSEPL